MALTLGHQVQWESVTLPTNGVTATHGRGEILPATTDPDETAARARLVMAGALRPVEIAGTDEDVAAAVAAQASVQAAQDAAEHAAETGGSQSAAPPVIDTPGGTVIDQS